MLKKWKCSFCGQLILAFEDDIKTRNLSSFCVINHGDTCTPQHDCNWFELRTYTQSTLHGEAGFMTEGTVLDSTDSIHDYEKVCTQNAADARELRSYLDARRNS